MPCRRAALLTPAIALATIAWAGGPSAAAQTQGGYDVSWPQCGATLPAAPAFGVVGVTDGLPYSTNPCLATEYTWAAGSGTPALYMNLAEPGRRSVHWNRGGPRPCSGSSSDTGCAYDYGWQAAQAAFSAAASTVTGSPAASAWWLDIETGNTWSSSSSLNRADIQGALDALAAKHVAGLGVYSTASQWRTITGGWTVAAPVAADWLAGAGSSAQAATWCTTVSGFSGGRVTLVQYPAGAYDGDVAC